MQDICLKTTDQTTLTDALDALGLARDGQITGDWLYVGKVLKTPGTYTEDGTETTAPVYLDGEYAVYRATDTQVAVIETATWPEGVSIVTPPDGISMFGGEWLQPDLTTLQAEACARIDASAEALCNTVVTPGSSQMARYTRKQAQAEAYLADPSPTADKYPAIYGEVGITADTVQAVAEVVLARAAAWWTYGDAIERARLAGKRAVESATTVAAIQAAEAAVEWPDLP